jgi:redox-sensing transcriptional repressor
MSTVPEATIKRLSKYYLILKRLHGDGVKHVKSADLILGRGLKPVQVRKDLSYCGARGTRGSGYRAEDLLAALRTTLGLDRNRNTCVVGLGVCGTMNARHVWVQQHGYPLVALFDRDPERTVRSLGDISVQPMSELAETVAQKNIEIAIVATDYGGAQDAADSLVSAGVRAIASFSDANLIVPGHVYARYVGTFLELAKFSCCLYHGPGNSIPESSVERLARYYRILVYLERMGVDMVTSTELGSGAGVNPLQARKDFAYAGPCGRRGRGYDVPSLREAVKSCLGLDYDWNFGIAGASMIGTAVVHHKWFQDRGFPARAIFDCDPNKIGHEIGHLVVHSLEDMKSVVRKEDIKIGLVTTPAAAAQEAADRWVDAGVHAIFNMTEASLGVPEGVVVRDMNLFTMMCILSSRLVDPPAA